MTLAIYSYIPYKTPWLDINFVLPLALLAGCGINEYAIILKGPKRYIPALIIIPLLSYSLYTALDVAYVNYNSENNKLSYVSTLDDYTDLIKEVSSKASLRGKNNTNISIVVTDPWPLPWSLRDYKVSYGGSQLISQIIISEKNDYSIINPDWRYLYGTPKKYEMRKWMYVYVYSWKDSQI
jgi:predicted membrane-bound mannosyltransferase